MRRFFLPPDALSGDRIVLAGPEARHMATVLRLRPGRMIELFDGQGTVFTAVLTECDRQRVCARVTAVRTEAQAAAAPLTVAQCLLKGKKMDLLVQKATELGVAALAPLVSRYCENHGDRAHQQERWQRIMLEACKQCHRAAPMAIRPVTPLAEADFSGFAHRLVAWEEERHAPLPTGFVAAPGPICLLLGPEGGLHGEDLAGLAPWQFAPFSLGPRILRGETAALAAISIIQYLSGDLRPAAAGPINP